MNEFRKITGPGNCKFYQAEPELNSSRSNDSCMRVEEDHRQRVVGVWLLLCMKIYLESLEVNDEEINDEEEGKEMRESERERERERE